MKGEIEMDFSIRIETSDKKLVRDVMETNELSANITHVKISDDTYLTFQGSSMSKSFISSPETVDFLLSLGASIATGVVANWLCAKLKDKKVTLRIDRIEVKINKDSIEKILIERIEKDG